VALPKILKQLDVKLDRILAILDAPVFPIAEETPAPMDPAAVAAAIDYDSYSAKEIIERIASLTDAERAALAVYEAGKQNRKTVLEKLQA
jgi:hypothetical protein